MTLSTATSRWKAAALPLFAALAAAVLAVEWQAAQWLTRHPGADALAVAITVDLVLVLPVLFGWLVVRRRGGSMLSVAPMVVLGLVAAHLILPPSHAWALRWTEAVAVGLEAGVLAWMLLRIRKVSRAMRASPSADLLTRLRTGTEAAFGSGLLADLLATELAVVGYALGLGGRREPGEAFPITRSSGYGSVVAGLLVAGALELAAGHLLLMYFWGPVPALVHAIVSGYGLLWIVADLRAVRARPVVLDPEARLLRVRRGLVWSADVPLATIAEVRRREQGGFGTADGYLDLTPMRRARYVVLLSEPLSVAGPLGLRRTVTRLGLDVDDRPRFEAALGDAIRPA